MSDEAMTILTNFQYWFIRLLLWAGPGTLRVALLSETGMKTMERRIWKEKVMMILHIRQLDEAAMAKKVWVEQMMNGWPGLAKDVEKICDTVGIDDANKTGMTAGEYAKSFEVACRGWEVATLKRAMIGTKAATIVNDDCEIKDYVKRRSLKDVRDIFSERVFLLPFGGNYKHDRKYGDGCCRACAAGVSETQAHVLECEGYSDVRAKVDVDTVDGRLMFFRTVIKIRDNLVKS